MKKFILSFLLVSSTLIFAQFHEQISKIDTFIQNKEYDKALSLSKEVYDSSNLSEEEKRALEEIIKEIEVFKIQADIKNNLGSLDVNHTNTDSITVSDVNSNSTTPLLFNESILKKENFDSYKEYEDKIISTNNSEAIYRLSLLYVKNLLYEHAMNLALKDKNKDTRNLFIAAVSARMIGEYNKSIKLYNQILSRYPNNPKSILGLAMAYKGLGDFKSALRYMKQYAVYDNSGNIENEIKLLEIAIQNHIR